MASKKPKQPKSPYPDRGADKTPRSRFDGPLDAKTPRGEPPNVRGMTPLWSFRILDIRGPWCWGELGGDSLRSVLQRLKEFETMTWGEIEGRDHHFVDVPGCCKKTRDRLVELRHDDADSLFSLRFTGKQRVFGIRDGQVLGILWWDPEHEVYPSAKKHT